MLRLPWRTQYNVRLSPCNTSLTDSFLRNPMCGRVTRQVFLRSLTIQSSLGVTTHRAHVLLYCVCTQGDGIFIFKEFAYKILEKDNAHICKVAQQVWDPGKRCPKAACCQTPLGLREVILFLQKHQVIEWNLPSLQRLNCFPECLLIFM